jgi:cyclopropane fatty-acyl-phospholipid synthase-like methyltransferase
MKQHAPATARNREPIGDVLSRALPPSGVVLELAAGSGEHSIYFAARFAHLDWQPTDVSGAALASIAAWRDEAALPNLRAPLRLDVCDSTWPVERVDAITCINMIHISPWQATLGMFGGAATVLAPGALLYLYGPYRFDGAFTAVSNEQFDRSLRERDPQWGVRDVRDVTAVATTAGFELREVIAMPANNHSLLFRRV